MTLWFVAARAPLPPPSADSPRPPAARQADSRGFAPTPADSRRHWWHRHRRTNSSLYRDRTRARCLGSAVCCPSHRQVPFLRHCAIPRAGGRAARFTAAGARHTLTPERPAMPAPPEPSVVPEAPGPPAGGAAGAARGHGDVPVHRPGGQHRAAGRRTRPPTGRPCAGTTPCCGAPWRRTGAWCSRRWGTRSTPPSPAPPTPWPRPWRGSWPSRREDWGELGGRPPGADGRCTRGRWRCQGGPLLRGAAVPLRPADGHGPRGAGGALRRPRPSWCGTPCRRARGCATWGSTG